MLAPIASVARRSQPNYAGQLANDYLGTGTLAYNRNTTDSKIDYIPTRNTQIFGKYSIEPFTVDDPQELGAAGGGTFDGGQPGAASGRIQNVGLGVSHVFTPSLVLDADFGYTRQVTGAQSTIDICDGNYGLRCPEDPRHKRIGTNYVGQPIFELHGGSTFVSSEMPIGANPFLFRDNQFTGDVNLSWIKGQALDEVRFHLLSLRPEPLPAHERRRRQQSSRRLPVPGWDDCGTAPKRPTTVYTYNALADFPARPAQQRHGRSGDESGPARQPQCAALDGVCGYAQDQWTATPKLTVNYGVRYEYYPLPYRDHTGVYLLDPTLPQSANVEIGGVNGNPENAGI